MDVAGTMQWIQSVAALRAHADSLIAAAVPAVTHEAGAMATAERSLGHALVDTTKAAQLLERVPDLDPATLTDARAAVELLGTATPTPTSLRDAGSGLTGFVDAATTRAREAMQQRAATLTSKLDTLDAAEQAELTALADGDAQIAGANAGVMQLLGKTSEQVAEIAAGFRSAKASELTHEDWATLAHLVDQDSPTVAKLPRTLEGRSSLGEWLGGLPDGTYTANAEVDDYLRAWRFAESSPAELDSLATRLRDAGPDALTADEWADLAALRDVDGNLATKLPSTRPGASSLEDWLPGLASGKFQNNGELDRYFAAWRLADAPETQLRAEAARLRDLPPADFTRADWATLDALVQADARGRIATIPRTMPGASNLDEWVNGLVTGTYEPNGEIASYFTAWKLKDASPEELRGMAQRLRDLDADEYTQADWSQLLSLIGSDSAKQYVKVPRTMSGLSDLDEWLPGLASGKYANNGELDQYIAAWRMVDTSPSERQAMATRLRAMNADDFTKSDWATLRALIAADSRGSVAKLPRSIEGASSLDEWLPGLISGKYANNGELDQYLVAWRMADAPAEELRATARRLRDTPADSYTRDDWSTLSALIAGDSKGAVDKLPRSVPGASDLTEWLPGLISGKYQNNGELDQYLAAWRLAETPASELQSMAARLRDLDADAYTKEDWALLSGLVAADPHGRIATIPRSLTGASDLSEWLPGLISGKYQNNGELDRYISAWRLSGASDDELRTMTQVLRDRPLTEYTREDWAQLAALLDADSRGRIGIPRQLDGASDLKEWLPGLITGKYQNNGELDRYFDAWRINDDPAHRARLEAAVNAVANGTGDREAIRLVGSASYRMADLVAGRPVEEQAAIAAVMLELDSVAGNRGVESILKSIRPQLADLDGLEPGLATLRDDTVGMIDRNLSRLAGNTPSGAVRGYSNHPDYAEIGRIRANAQLLTRARLQPAAEVADQVAATPRDAALASVDPPATAAGETLTW